MIRFGNVWLFTNTTRLRPMLWRMTDGRLCGFGALGFHVAYARRVSR